jgi:putative ABC transport system ATP-binding protein
MIELINITKDFSDGSAIINILKPTTIELKPHEFTAIVGPSGSGKSTLLTIIGALQKPTTGTLKINGQDVYSLSEDKQADLRFMSIGFVLQQSNLVPYLTVREQFEFKLQQSQMKNNRDQIDRILTLLEIKKLEKKYPDDISGGERQRVAIGLALLLEPQIILADEPTASLDTEKAINVVKTLKKISDEFESIVIMVTHDQRMLQYVDRTLEMKDGVLTDQTQQWSVKSH